MYLHASASIAASPKLKHQNNKFRIDIPLDYNIVPKKYQCSKLWLSWCNVGSFVHFGIHYKPVVFEINSFYFLSSLVAFADLISYLVKFNVFAMKQGLQSFDVWYKVIHVIIATFSRQIYTDYPSNINNNNVFYIMSGTVAAINLSILVFTVSVIDSIATKSNVIKHVALFVTVLMCLWYCIETYFNIYGDYVVNEQLPITIFGQTHQLSWRAITLSVFLKHLNLYLHNYFLILNIQNCQKHQICYYHYLQQ